MKTVAFTIELEVSYEEEDFDGTFPPDDEMAALALDYLRDMGKSEALDMLRSGLLNHSWRIYDSEQHTAQAT